LSRAHFFAAAAESMRRILVERARKKRRVRHGGAEQRVDLDVAVVAEENRSAELLAVHEALAELEQHDRIYVTKSMFSRIDVATPRR